MSVEPRLTDKKRCAIVDAALHEFQAKGFQATSMDAIAAAAGVSKRTVYNHFPSKEDLFRAISTAACRRAMHGSDARYCRETGVEEQLVGIAARKLEILISEEFMRMARVTLIEHLRSPELAAEAFVEIEKGETDVAAWIREASADGRLEVDDPQVAGKQFCALLNEFAFWPQLFGMRPAPDAEERARIASTTVALFLDHYGIRKR